MKASRTTAFLFVVALFAIGCEPKAADHEVTSHTVPMSTWVAGLCNALGRFANDVGLTAGGVDEPSESIDDSRFEEFVEAWRRLQREVQALGIPDVDDGTAIASDVIAGIRRSVAAVERASGPADLVAGLISAGPASSEYSAIAYPFVLLIYLGEVEQPVGVTIYVDDPVLDGTVTRLSRLLERRPDVATVRFETKAQACRKFKELFADQEALVENVDCDKLPASFRVQLTPGVTGTYLRDALIHEHGVEDVFVQPTLADLVAEMTIFTPDELLHLGRVRADASRQPECTSLPPVGAGTKVDH